MKNFLLVLICTIILDLIFHSCANPTAPTGGPKDTIPPLLVSSIPRDQKLNFDGQTISLTFDEFVTADKLKQSLIITPISEIDYKILYKKQTIILKFEEAFDDSTTYTFNFFDGITDITERNPAENLILAFSTGNYIDSIKIYGNVKDLFTGKAVPKMTVGIYRLTDSLDFFSTKPTYFTSTLEDGSFQIQNIKNNDYKLLAFLDENKNLLFDPAKESYAFLSDTLHLTESISDSLRLKSLSINASPLELISARPSGRYFEVRYTKPLTRYTVSHPDFSSTVLSDLSNESASVRFYNHLNLTETDSIKTILTVQDSLKNFRQDTVFIKFRSSSRKSTDYTLSLQPNGGAIQSDTRYQLNFNKPSLLLDSNLLFTSIDTLYQIEILPSYTSFNFNQTAFNFILDENFRQFYADTLKNLIDAIYIDTLEIDTPSFLIRRKLESLPLNKFTLNIRPGAFVSAEGDTSKLVSSTYSYVKPDDFGSIKLSIQTEIQSFFVQIMNRQKVERQLKNCRDCLISQLPPGNYWVRILVDENLDNTWSFGNFLNNTEPEPVFYFKEETSLRPNWQVELNYSF